MHSFLFLPSIPQAEIKITRYHVPEDIQPHIDYVTPGVGISPLIKPMMQTTAGSSTLPFIVEGHIPVPNKLINCASAMTGPCVKALYAIPNNLTASPRNTLGIYAQGPFSQRDLDLYFYEYAPQIPNGTSPTPVLIDGAHFTEVADSPYISRETSLDLQIAYA
jgi:tripeptidyl-peptidase-1